MYTHLIVTRESAKSLYPMVLDGAAYIGNRQIREAGVMVGETLDEHYSEYMQAYLRRLGCSMEIDRTTGLFVLKFRDYLPEVPQLLRDMQIDIVGAEIARFQSAPTKACAGYYRWSDYQATATVEPVFPTQRDKYEKPAPLYAQNISVKANSLFGAIEFHSRLCQGLAGQYLHTAWE